MSEMAFVEKIGLLASEDMKKTGILASVTTAQAILESGFGTTDLAVNANNLFGMKCLLSGNTWDSVWDGQSEYWKYTEEQSQDGRVYKVYANFRKYPDISHSIADHSAYLAGAMNGGRKRYAGIVGMKYYKKVAQLIKDGGYATDVNYVSKLCNIIENLNLTRFDTEYEKGETGMKIFLCVGHTIYKNGAISSADGTKYGGVNEYKYNKQLAPYVQKWLKAAGHDVTLCIAPEGVYSSLQDEIDYFIGEEHKKNYDLAVQLHLNAFNGKAYGTEAYAYDNEGLVVANAICKKLGTVWHNRGGQIMTGLYWTRQTRAMAVLVESFFCDNKDDCAKADKLGFDAHGKLIAEGIHGKNIKTESTEKAEKTEDTGKMYKVQVGAYSVKTNAEAMEKKLEAAGYDAFIKEE